MFRDEAETAYQLGGEATALHTQLVAFQTVPRHPSLIDNFLSASFKDCSNSSLERSGMWKNRFFNLCKKDNVEVGCSSFI
jgi:hypothetical protein